VVLLTTGREALSAAGEHAYPVPLLDVPPRSASITAAQAMGHSAVELFVERADSVLGHFSLTDETAPIVAEICRRLDGIPLAIELAAPRLKLLTPEALLAHLDDQLRLLIVGNRTVRRHYTLRAAIEWSYMLLSEAEQAMLCRLGIFAGSFTLEAVEAVATGAPVEASDVFDVLAGLVDKSLVVSLASAGENRYRLLESTRAFAREKLAAGRYAALARRLCEHMTIVFEQAERTWPTTARADWLAVYEPDLDNLRAAMGWSLGPDGDPALGVSLVSYTGRLWWELSLLEEQRRWFELALGFVDDSTPPTAEARIHRAFTCHRRISPTVARRATRGIRANSAHAIRCSQLSRMRRTRLDRRKAAIASVACRSPCTGSPNTAATASPTSSARSKGASSCGSGTACSVAMPSPKGLSWCWSA
jgi:predicted ATPase